MYIMSSVDMSGSNELVEYFQKYRGQLEQLKTEARKKLAARLDINLVVESIRFTSEKINESLGRMSQGPTQMRCFARPSLPHLLSQFREDSADLKKQVMDIRIGLRDIVYISANQDGNDLNPVIIVSLALPGRLSSKGVTNLPPEVLFLLCAQKFWGDQEWTALSKAEQECIHFISHPIEMLSIN